MTYLIWSNQRGMWWRSNESGYTQYIEEAGRYEKGQAEAIVRKSTVNGALVRVRRDLATGIPYQFFDEVMVPAEGLPRSDDLGGQPLDVR